jgi:tRNA pseudouridine55 synthase
MNGLLLVNKPTGITSFDVIRQLRRTTGLRKIGHAGTLDPQASGLMLILFGDACKQASRYSKLDKTYRAEITLGATSTTGDSEGIITPSVMAIRQMSEKQSAPTLDVVRSTLDTFTGQITQTPSVYSAIKIKGQAAYKYARKGQAVEVPSRTVTVHGLRLTRYEYPKLEVEAKVSSGTYIRTLAEDIGKKLETGGYLSALTRTEVGEYRLAAAISLDNVSRTLLESRLC